MHQLAKKSIDTTFFKRHMKKAASVFIATVLTVTFPGTTIVHAQTSDNRERQFTAAANEFQVPKELLMAISYNYSRWENHDGKPSVSGGHGLMHLTASFEQEDGRGDSKHPLSRTTIPERRTLEEAAQLINVRADTLKHDDYQNIRGGAALLAKYAKKINDGRLPASLDNWYGATAQIGHTQDFADDVFDTIENGTSLTTSDNQTLRLTPRPVTPNLSQLENLSSIIKNRLNRGEAECPFTIDCKFVPARYAQNNPDEPTDYGNYSLAERPHDMKIKYIVIHDIEGSYQSAIDWFQNQNAYVSSHYVIRSSDGEVTQMVKNKDVAWHAGNWYMNMHSIGIEHEGFAAEGATWYTEAMYRSSAKLVRHLAQKYDIPLDREHIIGHDQYHATSPETVAGMHWDPGPFWDWEHYMRLLHAPVVPTAWHNSDVITIAPRFNRNQPTLTECEDGTCSNLPAQPANFVYVRTEPDASAPLIGDIGIHPDGSPGTTAINDTSSKASYGQRFAVAERRGNWTAIWFNGQKGWFYGSLRHRTAIPTQAQTVTPKPGKDSVPIYGVAYPEAEAYPSTIPRPATVPLQYTILAGQKYPLYAASTPTDYFYDWTFDRSVPDDNTVVVGNEKYIPISYNHRQAFVKAADVTVTF